MGNIELFNLLDKTFINYSTLDSKYLKYINDIGLMRFTKYLVRAQQYILHDMLGKKLGRIIAMDGIASMLGFNLPTPLNSILFNKLFKLQYSLNVPVIGDIKNLTAEGYGDIFSINNQLEYIGSKFFK